MNGSIVDRGEQGIAFRVRDRKGSDSIAVRYDGVVPDPFRDGREIIIKGTVVNGVFEGEPDTLVTKCPSKFSEKKESAA